MKALTFCQPYAHLIIIGEKRIENRTRQTQHRGPLVIHAGKSRKYLEPGDEDRFPDMVFGAVVGVAHLVACLRLKEIIAGDIPKPFEWVQTDQHTEGPWCWVLQDAVRLPRVIPWRGELSLFEIPDEVLGVCEGPAEIPV